MTAERKILLIGRHGKAPKKAGGGSLDELVPEAITEVYQKVGVPLSGQIEEYNITTEGVFVRHTNAVRTRFTAQAILAGAFDLKPSSGNSPPTSVEDLGNYDFSNFEVLEEPRFNIPKPDGINLKVYSEQGPAANVDYWLANPSATEHEGVPIETYESIRARMTAGILDAVGNLVSDGKDLGLVVIHATHAEPAVIALVNTARSMPVAKTEEIGGAFEMGEFAQLTIEGTAGGVYRAKFERKGQKYDVDITKL